MNSGLVTIPGRSFFTIDSSKPELAKVLADIVTCQVDISVSKRIAALVKFELEPVDYAILEVLQRSKCFTRQLLYLERMESDYGL